MDLERPFDMSLSLHITAVLTTYVHTQRYLMELINYWMYLIQLQDVLIRTRALMGGIPVRRAGSRRLIYRR